MLCVPVCLNLYVWKSASPLRLCWTWGLFELTSPQQKGLGIGRMPKNASLIDGWCVCLCAWTYMCENLLHHPSAYVGHEDCLNSPLHNKRAWGSAECLKTLVSLMDGVYVPVCLNLYVWKSASPLRLCWTWGLFELTSPQQKGCGIGRMPQNASLIDGWCVCACVLELIYVKICITPPLMLDMRIVWTHLSTTKGPGDRQNA